MYFYSNPNSTPNSLYTYNICSKTFCADIKIDSLSRFLVKETQSGKTEINANLINQNDLVPIYEGPGIIGDSVRKISFWKINNSYKLIIQDVGKFLIIYSPENTEIFLIDSKLPADHSLIIESLLGPVLIYGLALDGIFCLHASAVVYDGNAILFMGKSASGKSTLADYLDRKSNNKINRIADDIVPVGFANNSFHVLPHFPQLKLSKEHQYSLDKPAIVAVSNIYLLEKTESEHAEIQIEKLGLQDSIMTLVSNTVASRLFDNNLNRNHLNFCSKLINGIPAKKILYPHNKENLSLIQQTVLKDLIENK